MIRHTLNLFMYYAIEVYSRVIQKQHCFVLVTSNSEPETNFENHIISSYFKLFQTISNYFKLIAIYFKLIFFFMKKIWQLKFDAAHRDIDDQKFCFSQLCIKIA